MSLLTVVQDVCAVVGVQAPTSVIASINSNRTMFEMFSLANEMAQRIASNTREWQQLTAQATFVGDGQIVPPGTAVTGTEMFLLPNNYQRLLLTSNVWRSTSAIQPMMFIPSADEWLQRRLHGYVNAWGEWAIFGNTMQGPSMHIWPIMHGVIDNDPLPPTLAETATFNYLDKNCVRLFSGGKGDAFIADNDVYVLDERLLKLGMIWQWKANKGSPYAEDMATWQDALMVAQGADRPAPILVGRKPISWASRASYPFPIDPGMRPM